KKCYDILCRRKVEREEKIKARNTIIATNHSLTNTANMSSKSNLKSSAKSSKNSASSVSTTNSKTDTKSKKKVTLEDDDDGDENEGALAYKVLSADQCKSLIALEIDQLQSTDLTDASILDYYTGALWWAKEQGFTIQQMSGFFTVVHTLLDNVKEQRMPMVENLKEFKKMLIGIEPEYPDLEIEVAKAANVPFPPPLDEGADENLYQTYIATPPPTPAAKSRSRSAKSARSKSSSGSSRQEEEEKVEEPATVINIEESDVFSQLTPEDNDMAVKLREKENAIISRINKIHKVAEDEEK
ncbi:hypothetical protein KUTeg_006458, partial [Tegillarca granosa]